LIFLHTPYQQTLSLDRIQQALLDPLDTTKADRENMFMVFKKVHSVLIESLIWLDYLSTSDHLQGVSRYHWALWETRHHQWCLIMDKGILLTFIRNYKFVSQHTTLANKTIDTLVFWIPNLGLVILERSLKRQVIC